MAQKEKKTFTFDRIIFLVVSILLLLFLANIFVNRDSGNDIKLDSTGIPLTGSNRGVDPESSIQEDDVHGLPAEDPRDIVSLLLEFDEKEVNLIDVMPYNNSLFSIAYFDSTFEFVVTINTSTGVSAREVRKWLETFPDFENYDESQFVYKTEFDDSAESNFNARRN